MLLGQSEIVFIKFTEKFFTETSMMHHFLKFYSNKLEFIIYKRLEQKPNRAKCEQQQSQVVQLTLPALHGDVNCVTL